MRGTKYHQRGTQRGSLQEVGILHPPPPHYVHFSGHPAVADTCAAAFLATPSGPSFQGAPLKPQSLAGRRYESLDTRILG